MGARFYDIAIAGGGMVGASLALALRGSGRGIALIESVAPGEMIRHPASAGTPDAAATVSQPQPSYDERGIALSVSGQRVLEHVGAWDLVRQSAFPIRRVHVSEQSRFGCVRLDAEQLGVPALGHVVVARRLGEALWTRVRAAGGIDTLCPDSVTHIELEADSVRVQCRESSALKSRLLVIADGADSPLRAALGIDADCHEYDQTAIVANVTCRLPHDGTAFERFSSTGPLALLPLDGARMVSVNCVSGAAAAGWLEMDDAEYCGRLGERFGLRLGGFVRCGARRAYPLRRVMPKRQSAGRALLLGNAALTIHPNGAQGFNLALRDVAALAEAVATVGDPGAEETVAAFLAQRRADRARVAWLSHGLARAFAGAGALRAGVRGAGMLLADMLPPVKRDLMLLGSGLRAPQPAWVRSVV
jgi:2-octaprenyl-6-methoxyphenol hydroxylase